MKLLTSPGQLTARDVAVREMTSTGNLSCPHPGLVNSFLHVQPSFYNEIVNIVVAIPVPSPLIIKLVHIEFYRTITMVNTVQLLLHHYRF